MEIQKQFPQIQAGDVHGARGGVKVAVEAMRRGAVDFSGKAVSEGTVHDGAGADCNGSVR